MKLDVKAFAITCGLLMGLGLFLATWWIIILDGPSDRMTFIGQVYRGYGLNGMGSLVGLIWGLVDGAIGGAIFAWLYNSLARDS
jgi:hypothetical protein